MAANKSRKYHYFTCSTARPYEVTAFQRRVLNRFHGHSVGGVGLTVVAAHNEAVLARVLAVAHGAGRVVVGAPQPDIIYGGQPLFRA